MPWWIICQPIIFIYRYIIFTLNANRPEQTNFSKFFNIFILTSLLKYDIIQIYPHRFNGFLDFILFSNLFYRYTNNMSTDYLFVSGMYLYSHGKGSHLLPLTRKKRLKRRSLFPEKWKVRYRRMEKKKVQRSKMQNGSFPYDHFFDILSGKWKSCMSPNYEVADKTTYRTLSDNFNAGVPGGCICHYQGNTAP